jgi:hypothetical protein
MDFKIVAAGAAASTLEAWRREPSFAAVEAHPVPGAFGRGYFPLVFEETRRDESFALVLKDIPVLMVSCTAGSEQLDYYGMPARLFVRTGLDEQTAAAAIDAAFSHIDGLALERGITRISVSDQESIGVLSPIGGQCVNRRANAALQLNGCCDLAGGETGIRQGLRKSFRSLINWGKRNLELCVVGMGNPDRALFDRYRSFHRAVAGRVTRAQASWDFMFEWIAAGRGELVLAFWDGELVAGTLVIDGVDTSLYSSGVYDRERFDKPMAHWPIWHAMLRASERGRIEFDLGSLPLPGVATPKEFAIGYFKRGFATSIKTSIAWTWSIAAPEAAGS